MRAVVLIAFLALTRSATAATPLRFSPGLMVWCSPDTMEVIRAADAVYVLPVRLIEKRNPRLGKGAEITPRGDFKHVRPLDAAASSKLRRLLGRDSNWFHGFDNTISVDHPQRSVGFIFRRGRDKLVLLCGLGSRLDGTFNGAPTGGSLEDKPWDKLEEWKKQYATPELTTK